MKINVLLVICIIAVCLLLGTNGQKEKKVIKKKVTQTKIKEKVTNREEVDTKKGRRK